MATRSLLRMTTLPTMSPGTDNSSWTRRWSIWVMARHMWYMARDWTRTVRKRAALCLGEAKKHEGRMIERSSDVAWDGSGWSVMRNWIWVLEGFGLCRCRAELKDLGCRKACKTTQCKAKQKKKVKSKNKYLNKHR